MARHGFRRKETKDPLMRQDTVGGKVESGFARAGAAVGDAVNKLTGQDSVSPSSVVELRRGQAERVKLKLQEIRFQNLSGKLPNEDLEEYRVYVNAFIRSLDSSAATWLETREIDRYNEKFAEKLGHALRDGNGYTADWMVEALYYGLREARKDILEQERDREGEIREKRVEKLKSYASIMDICNNMEDLQEKISKMQQDCSELKMSVEADLDALEELTKDPVLIRDLDNYGREGDVPGNPEDLNQALRLIARINGKRDQVLSYVTTVNQFLELMDSMKINIETLRMDMSLEYKQLDPETIQRLDSVQDRINHTLNATQDVIERQRSMMSDIAWTVEGFSRSDRKVTAWLRELKRFREEQEREEIRQRNHDKAIIKRNEDEARKLREQLEREQAIRESEEQLKKVQNELNTSTHRQTITNE